MTSCSGVFAQKRRKGRSDMSAKVGLEFFSMERELSEVLGHEVDLNTPGFLSPHFRDEILGETEVIYDAA